MKGVDGIDHEKIVWQKCFRIRRDKLGELVDFLRQLASNLSYFYLDQVFPDGRHCDVVVIERGHPYPFQYVRLEKFVEGLNQRHSIWKRALSFITRRSNER